MIINNNHTSNVESVGHIERNKVSIDTKNVNFITQLLTTKLYSTPIESFIREIVANAVDAHKEANNSEPVLISVRTGVDNIFVEIRDYGTGLSPERFNLIYKNIGSSTKRDSNDYIGAFGIGRFAPLSCSNVVTINNYYDGTKYTYLMYLDNTELHIDCISKVPTTEHNGLEVSVTLYKGMSTMTSITEGLRNIALMPNVFVTFDSDTDSFFNKRNTIEFEHFKVNTFCYTNSTEDCFIKVDIGNVLYPVSLSKLGIESIFSKCYLHFSQGEYSGNLSLIIKSEMGEIDIAPNREDIIYTKDTTELLRKKIKDVEEELLNVVKEQYKDGFKSINEYDNIIKYRYTIFIPVIKYQNCDISLSVSPEIICGCSKNIIDGEPIPDKQSFDRLLPCVLSNNLPIWSNVKDKYKSTWSTKIYRPVRLYDENIVLINLEGSLRDYVKDYIKEKFPNQRIYILKKNWKKEAFSSLVKAAELLFNFMDMDTHIGTLKYILRHYDYSNFIIHNIKVSDIPKPKKDKSSIQRTTNYYYRVYTNYSDVIKRETISYSNLISTKNCVKVYAENNNETLREFCKLCGQMEVGNIICIETSIKYVKDLKENTPRGWMHISEIFTKKLNAISKKITLLYIRKHYSLKLRFSATLDTILNREQSDLLSYLSCISPRAQIDNNFLYTLYVQNKWFKWKYFNSVEFFVTNLPYISNVLSSGYLSLNSFSYYLHINYLIDNGKFNMSIKKRLEYKRELIKSNL